MTLEEAVVAHLHAAAAVRELVGKRIYPGAAPEASTQPFIVFSEAARQDVRSTDGPSGLASTTLQFDCWAARKLDASAIADRLRSSLEGFSGQMGAGPDEPGLHVSPCLLVSRGSDFEPDLKLHSAVLQFTFWHRA